MLCRDVCVACVLNVSENVPDFDVTWPDLAMTIDVDMVKPSLA